MNYEERYKQALERAMKLAIDGYLDAIAINDIFPELKESEDEKIRKDIISYLRNEKIVKRYISDIEIDKWIAWLEKQGKKLDADKVIAWLEDKQPSVALIDKFKKDFGL